MKKIWSIVLVGLLVVGAASVAVAQEASPSPERSRSRPTREERAQRLGQRAKREFFPIHSDGVAMKRDGTKLDFRTQKGIIQAVDGGSITLKSPDGYTQTYAINEGTKVREKGQPSSAADLKSGEMAKVFAVKEGSGYTAKLINCVGEPGPRLRELIEKANGQS